MAHETPVTTTERRLVLALALLATFASAWAFHDVRLDDAYITFRYGENLARGAGLVFNPGEKLLGTTAPGHSLASAVLHGLVGHARLPDAMSVLGVVAWTAQAASAWALVRARGGRARAACVGLGLLVGAARSEQFLPLETNVVAAFVLGSFVLAQRGAWLRAGAAMGLAVLWRNDAALAALPLVAWAVVERRARALPVALVVAIVPLVWLAFAWRYYGSPLPVTLGAKSFSSSLSDYVVHELELPVASAMLLGTHLRVAYDVPVTILGWALATLGAVVLVRGDRRLGALVAWALLHAAAYAYLRPNRAFLWHLYPCLLVFATLALAGLGALVARLPRRWRALAFAPVIALVAVEPAFFAREHAHLFWYGARDAVSRRIAAFLVARGGKDAVFDAEEVGTVAYWSDLRAIDHPGLVTRTERLFTAQGSGDRAGSHARAMEAVPGLRFVISNPREVAFHAPLCEGHARTTFEEPARNGARWTLLVCDRAAPER